MLALLFAVSFAWQVPAQPHVSSEQPFEAVALSWSGSATSARVRGSADGVVWTEWQVARLDEDLTDRSEARYYTGIVHFGAPQRFIEHAVDGEASGVTLTLFEPPPAEPIERGAGALTLGSVAVRSRSEWGCPDGQGSRWTPAYTTVTHAIVHHTAGANSLPDWELEIRNIWFFHTVTRGWGDIGYNFLIDPNGVVYEGRAGGDGAIGAHFSCRNTNTAGVALLGTYTSGPPTAAALESLKAVLTGLTRKHGLVPAEVARHVPSGLDLARVSGHRDANPSPLVCSTTECPGNVLYSMLPSIRTSLSTCTPVSIDVHPASTSASTGAQATLSVVPAGSTPHTFQWYVGKSGDASSPIDGGTGSSIVVAPGTYWVRVANGCGTADSATAIVGEYSRRRAIR